MVAAIATGLSGILNEFLAVLHGVRDDLCLGLLALLTDFLADDAKWRGVLTDFHDNSPHFARSIKENYPFRIDGSIFLSDILHHKISLSDYKKLQYTIRYDYSKAIERQDAAVLRGSRSKKGPLRV
jgi:hypothetical protein